MKRAVAALAPLVLLLALPAFAGEPPPMAAGINFARLPAAMIDAKFELGLGELSAAVLGCFGGDLRRGDDNLGSTAYGGGAQLLWWGIGDRARGMHVGVEGRVEWRTAKMGNSNNNVVTDVDSRAWHVGALVGGRYASVRGVFIGGQLGARRVMAATKASCCGGQTLNKDEASWAPLLVMDAGWLF